MNERTVARVLGIVYGAAGREVTDMVVDAWSVALAKTPDRGDELEVAAEVARSVEFVTLADFFKALVASRRRQALEKQRQEELAAGDDVWHPLSHPANWAAFAYGVRRGHQQLRVDGQQGRPEPHLPDEVPQGASMTRILNDLFLPLERDLAECWNGGGEPKEEAPARRKEQDP